MVNLLKNGFIRREDLDFTDDGSRFTAYEYNGLVITKCTYKGEYYISVRVDYLNGTNFTYEDYSNQDWYMLCDEFNGVTEVDIEKLKANMDIIKEGVDKLQEQIAHEELDYSKVENSLKAEALELELFIIEHQDIDILKIKSEYSFKRLFDYFSSLKRELESIYRKISDKNYTRYDYQKLERMGYVIFNGTKNCFYCKEIVEITK